MLGMPTAAPDLAEQRSIRRYGWRPSLPDARDLVADPSELKLAAEVDPRPHLPAVFDQGQLGSCTANAVAAALQYDRILDGHDPGVLSRLFVYFFERRLEGQPATADTGAYGRDGFKVARTLGVPTEELWPYEDSNPGRFSQTPPPAVLAAAATQKLLKDYRAVARKINDFKLVLSQQQTVAFGFSVYESFESDEVARTGVMPVPARGERLLGGHEVLMVGYLRSHPNHCLVRNSWGTGWGDGGYFLMPWAVVLDPQMSSDFRTIRRPAAAR